MIDRATSTTLSYVLTLSIATILVGGLIVAGSSFVEDRREEVIEQELEVIGEHIASNIDQVDRYARASDDLAMAEVEQTFPADVTGSTYNVKLVNSSGSDPTLFLNSTQPAVSVSVNVTAVSTIASSSSAGGGRIVAECVVSRNECDRIVISNE